MARFSLAYLPLKTLSYVPLHFFRAKFFCSPKFWKEERRRCNLLITLTQALFGVLTRGKIFLLSATPSYGYVGGNPLSPCFIVHATIRNDYTPQQPVDSLYNDSQGRAWFIMYAKLYDKNGNQIQSQSYIPPNGHPNSNQQNITSNETETLTILMVTSNRNIDHYTLAFGWIGTIPAP